MWSRGYQLKVSTGVKDLGIDAAASTRKPTATLGARFVKMKRRATRLAKLRRWSSIASKLVNTNLMPAGTYGIGVFGAARGLIDKMRTIAAAGAAGFSGQCTTTAIALALPQHADPIVAVRIRVLRNWINLWRHSPRR